MLTVQMKVTLPVESLRLYKLPNQLHSYSNQCAFIAFQSWRLSWLLLLISRTLTFIDVHQHWTLVELIWVLVNVAACSSFGCTFSRNQLLTGSNYFVQKQSSQLWKTMALFFNDWWVMINKLEYMLSKYQVHQVEAKAPVSYLAEHLWVNQDAADKLTSIASLNTLKSEVFTVDYFFWLLTHIVGDKASID